MSPFRQVAVLQRSSGELLRPSEVTTAPVNTLHLFPAGGQGAYNLTPRTSCCSCAAFSAVVQVLFSFSLNCRLRCLEGVFAAP